MTEEGDFTSVRRTLRDAQLRCEDLARNETLMGFPESGAVYRAMAEEFSALIPWVSTTASRRYAEDLRFVSALYK